MNKMFSYLYCIETHHFNPLKKKPMKTITTPEFAPTAVIVSLTYLNEFEKAMKSLRFQGVCYRTCHSGFDFVEDANEMAMLLLELGVPFNEIKMVAIENDNAPTILF